MARHYFHNHTAFPQIMGGKLIPPGEGREVDDVHLPAGEVLPGVDAGLDTPTPEGDAPTDAQLRANLAELLKQPLKNIVPGLAEHSDATLNLLAELESADGTPRKSLLGAIGELQLQRAQAKTGAPT